MTLTGIALLGATGSIGRSALNVVARHRERYAVRAVTSNANVEALSRIAAEHQPSFVGVVAPQSAAPHGWRVGAGVLTQAAIRPDVQVVVNAVVGVAGLEATLAALLSGKRVALANKESLVVGGELCSPPRQRVGENSCR